MSEDVEPDHVHNTDDTQGHSHSDISLRGERRNITVSVSDSSNIQNKSHGLEAPSLDNKVFILFLLNLFFRNNFIGN
jgi:hypothetical protein